MICVVIRLSSHNAPGSCLTSCRSGSCCACRVASRRCGRDRSGVAPDTCRCSAGHVTRRRVSELAACECTGRCNLQDRCGENTTKIVTDRSHNIVFICRVQWLRGRAIDSTKRTWVRILCDCVITLGKFVHSTLLQLLSCINEYLAIDSGGYVYEQPSRINCSI